MLRYNVQAIETYLTNWPPDPRSLIDIPGCGVEGWLSPQFWHESKRLGIGVNYLYTCATNHLTLCVVLNVRVHPDEGNWTGTQDEQHSGQTEQN